MFGTLANRLGEVFERLKKRGALTEADVDAALREVRIALLEADVALAVVKEFIATVREKAIGQEVLKSITPGQMVVKIVYDYLVRVLGGEQSSLHLSASPPMVYMIMGLQGSGKTTTTAKIAWYLTTKKRKKVLMASTDVYRPAAQEQLKVLGKHAQIATLSIVEGEKPVAIAKRALAVGRTEGYDVILIDTAGRLHIDEPLMEELTHLRDVLTPTETLLVADAMTGQDAVTIAQVFKEKVGLSGIILTRIDGDARGGAALSMRAVTGSPIKMVGIGERIEQLEEFYPERIARRILDMGDVVSLVEKAIETFDQEETHKLTQKVGKGEFDLEDLLLQLKQVSKMGGMKSIMNLLPGMGKVKEQLQGAKIDEKMITHQIAIIESMTKKERRFYKLMNASRRKRIALGSGTSVPEVNRLLKQFQEMHFMMKRFNKLGEKGIKRHGLKEFFR